MRAPQARQGLIAICRSQIICGITDPYLAAGASPSRSGFAEIPPVTSIPGMESPTALAWLRRRGPEVGKSELHYLFRSGQVRAYGSERARGGVFWTGASKIRHAACSRVPWYNHFC